MKAKLITLDGIDGSGKSTHIEFVRKWLEGKGVDFVMTREPGGTPLGEKVRAELLRVGQDISPAAEALLMFACRQQLLDDVVVKALNAGKWVVSDRFTDATYAYQAYGRGVSEEKIAQLERWAQGDLRPDLTFILDLPLETAMGRLDASRVKDRFELEGPGFFARVKEGYLRRAKADPGRCVVIDTGGAIEAARDEIRGALEKLWLRSQNE